MPKARNTKRGKEDGVTVGPVVPPVVSPPRGKLKVAFTKKRKRSKAARRLVFEKGDDQHPPCATHGASPPPARAAAHRQVNRAREKVLRPILFPECDRPKGASESLEGGREPSRPLSAGRYIAIADSKGASARLYRITRVAPPMDGQGGVLRCPRWCDTVQLFGAKLDLIDPNLSYDKVFKKLALLTGKDGRWEVHERIEHGKPYVKRDVKWDIHNTPLCNSGTSVTE